VNRALWPETDKLSGMSRSTHAKLAHGQGTVFLLRSDSPNFAPIGVRTEVAVGPMKIAVIFGLLTLCLALPANAQDGGARWVTFKAGTWPGYGHVLHQIDRTTIKQEGPYKTYSARVWVILERQP
jgi:hypothetical protein